MKYLLSALLCLFVCERSFAQESVANVFGHVTLESPEEAGNLEFGMQDVTSGTMIETTQPDTSGTFEFPMLPFATYDLFLRNQGQTIFLRRIVVESPLSLHFEFDSVPTTQNTSGSPVAPAWPQAHTLFTVPTIPELPVANTVDQIEAVSLNTPGMIADADGRMHLRGEDRSPENVLDGIPITTEETRSMAPLFDAMLIESANILRGSMDPAYGSDGIMNITTKSGFDATSFGHAEYDIGTNGNSSEEVDLGGRGGNAFAYYGSYGNFSTNRYLDPLTGPNPNHTNGSGSDYFGKVNILPADNLTITALGYYAATTFQIPNILTNSLQDQEESLFSTIFGLDLDYNLTANSVISAMGYMRRNDINISSNDIYAVIDSTATLLNILGARNENFASGGKLAYSARTNWFGVQNFFSSAAELEICPLNEYLSFWEIGPPFPDSIGVDRRPYIVDTGATGKRISAYVQDHVTVQNWTFSGGFRYDLYDLLDKQSGISPRLNLAYRASDNLMFRASYNRLFEEYPLENLLVSSTQSVALLSSTSPNIVQSEQSNNLEIGGRYNFDDHWDVDLSGYYKSLDNMLISYQLGNSGLYFPGNVKNGTIYGGELELTMRDVSHFYGSLGITSCFSKAIIPAGSSPYGAGLRIGGIAESYAQASVSQTDFNTEYGEPLAALFLLRYQPPGEFFFVLDGRFDSGLPFGLADSNGVAPDATRSRQILEARGVNDVTINLLNLNSTTTTKFIAPHGILNFSIGYNLSHFGLPVMISGSVVNIFNTAYLTRFDPVAGGAYYGVPRTFLLEAELSP